MQANAVETIDATRPALIVTYGSTPRKYRRLEGDLLVIGRGRGCDIGLASPEIAECHCLVYRTPGGWRLRDAGSRSGTRVNGKTVHDVPLRDQDVLQVGTITFRVQLPEPNAAGSPAEPDRRLQRSRRSLARLALALRRRLHLERARRGNAPSDRDLTRRQAELDRQMILLCERLRECEQRASRLDETERAFAADRERLDKESAALRACREDVERQSACRQESEERCQEKARRLDLRSRELSHFAHCLRRTIERLEATQAAGNSENDAVERCRLLEDDRRLLNEQLGRMRERANALDEAAVALERDLSEERARLARERLELNRLREEVRQVLEEAVSDARLRDRLAVVHRLRDELSACASGCSV
jgi:hypothetical protein